jgi:hypothetical protein
MKIVNIHYKHESIRSYNRIDIRSYNRIDINNNHYDLQLIIDDNYEEFIYNEVHNRMKFMREDRYCNYLIRKNCNKKLLDTVSNFDRAKNENS